MYKILVIGGSGYIGSNLGLTSRDFLKTYKSKMISNGIYFNIEKDSIKNICKIYKNIKYVIIAGGLFNFNVISSNIKYSQFINIECIVRLLIEIRELNLKPVYLSSESVFDGNKIIYHENDVPKPIFEYGIQKYKIEEFIKINFNDYLILRLSKVYGKFISDKTLVTTWLNKFLNNENIECAIDNYFSPIYLDDAVKYIETLILNNQSGIYNITSSLSLSRITMLKYVLNIYTTRKIYSGCIIEKNLHDFSTAKSLPLNTTLSASKIIEATGHVPLTFYEATKIILNYNLVT